MSYINHAQIENLLRTLILPFYHIKRDIPLPIGERRWENDAEHSWSLAMLACCLAPEIDDALDVGIVCQLAIVHDLVEVYANDTSTFASEADLASKANREKLAYERIAKEFSHFPWIINNIEIYERKDINEAKFVYALDKYIAVIYDYIDEGKLFKERKVSLAEYNKSLEDHRNKARSHSVVAKYYEEVRNLLNDHPEYFYCVT